MSPLTDLLRLPSVWRWLVFNAVGVLGFTLQMGALAGLIHLGVPYLVATALAVEAAVLHNFAWHERWTWRDRALSAHARAARLLRFHLLNGLVSLAGNIGGTWMLVRAGLPPLPANAASVLACALVTFVAGNHVVFIGEPPVRARRLPTRQAGPKKGTNQDLTPGTSQAKT